METCYKCHKTNPEVETPRKKEKKRREDDGCHLVAARKKWLRTEKPREILSAAFIKLYIERDDKIVKILILLDSDGWTLSAVRRISILLQMIKICSLTFILIDAMTKQSVFGLWAQSIYECKFIFYSP